MSEMERRVSDLEDNLGATAGVAMASMNVVAALSAALLTEHPEFKNKALSAIDEMISEPPRLGLGQFQKGYQGALTDLRNELRRQLD